MVSPGPDPQVPLEVLEQTRKEINRLVDEIVRLSEVDLPPAEYYNEFLKRVREAVAAPAGAVWLRTPQGHLQLQCQINVRQVGLDRSEHDRQTHDELLRLAAQTGRPQLVPPHSSTAAADDGRAAPGNPTDYVILMTPILVDKQVAGLIEIWQDADRNPNAQRGFLQFLTRMAELASSYTRNHQLRQMLGQQTLWTQLEAFARQIHGSLNPMEVGYVVANEGRRLVDCDRVSVGLRRGRKTRIEAISGADVVERRSNLVRLMAKLLDKVLKWGEKLTYKGIKDDSLPPGVLKALDNYLAESNSKVLVVLPLRDDREGENRKKPPRSALLMECFDPQAAPEQLVARLEVIGRHATSALYNAAEYRRIPMRFLWLPLAKLQEGLGGKARAITLAVVAALAVLVAALVFIPYPLKMDAKGQLLPIERYYLYAPVAGHIKEFKITPGQDVNIDDPLVLLHDDELQKNMIKLQGEIYGAREEVRGLDYQLKEAKAEERVKLSADKVSKQAVLIEKELELEAIRTRVNAEAAPGDFVVKSPLTGTVLGGPPNVSGSFVEELTHRAVKPNEPILRVGNKKGNWQIELKIPQKHIGQVLQAFHSEDANEELDVDLVLRSRPTRTYRAKLARRDIGGEAIPNRDDNNEAEPIVLAYVRIDGNDIDPDYRLPQTDNYLLTGTEVVAKVRCGNHALGYSLFYGVWEFFYEKIVFFF